MASAEEVFDQDEDGIVVVRIPEPGLELLEAVRRAEFLCPAQAIRLTEPAETVR